MAEEFIDMCAVCKQGVPKSDMVYQKGKVFHSQCFTDHGSSFTAPDSEIAQLSARTRIELVQLKNMKARAELEKQLVKTQNKQTKKKSKSPTKKRTKTKRKPKRRKATKKSTSSKSKKKSRRRR
ncbi:MAG TPA: hypothetical protein VNK44_03230 [Candidatus Nitrosotenuis sp.]|nr:hypothetical protein [Candidatus Nitrosotenuis sp.]